MPNLLDNPLAGLDTVFRYTPDLLGRRSLPYLNRVGIKLLLSRIQNDVHNVAPFGIWYPGEVP